MENSKIEWTDHTFNPWIGCTRVSAACDNCYAEDMMDRRYGRVEWGAGKPRQRTSRGYWRQPERWNRQAEAEGMRPRVFCASLADVFDTEVPDVWRDDLFDLIYDTPNLDWLLLTKRPAEARKHYERWGWPTNIWIGTTVESQEVLAARWRFILTIPRLRFISAEPLLGSLTFRDLQLKPDWVIVGGESGPRARPMQKRWATALRKECERDGIAFFMKQMWGSKRKALKAIPKDLRVRQLPVVS